MVESVLIYDIPTTFHVVLDALMHIRPPAAVKDNIIRGFSVPLPIIFVEAAEYRCPIVNEGDSLETNFRAAK